MNINFNSNFKKTTNDLVKKLKSSSGELYQRIKKPAPLQYREFLAWKKSQPDNYTAESMPHDEFSQKVEAYWQTGIEGDFRGVGNINIKYRQFNLNDAKATVVIVPGTSETQIKYQEFIYDISKFGFSIFIYDQRGHGLSDRICGDPEIVHVDRFEYYVRDLEKFIATIVKPQISNRLFIFAHSLGGTVAAHYCAKYPYMADAVILNCPMFSIKTHGIPKCILRIFLFILIVLKKGDRYALGQGPANLQRNIEDSGTSSSPRFRRYLDNILKDPHQLNHGGVSNNWLHECIKAGSQTLKKAAKIKTPIMILQAENDLFVENEAQGEFCVHAPNLRKYFIEKSHHETWNDVDQNRNNAMDLILEFYHHNL